MASENLMQSSLAPVRGTGTHYQLSEITHDLKNCMSILFYWVETVEMDRGSTQRGQHGGSKEADRSNDLPH